jgi:hypothetical protein
MVAERHKITYVPLFKKLWDIIFFDPWRGQKSLGPLKMSREMAHKVMVPQKNNYVPQFLKQRYINSYLLFSYFITYIHTFIQSHSSVAIRWGLSPFPQRLYAQWETPPCGAEQGIELGPALQYSKPTRYTVKRVDEVVRHPHLVTQDQKTQVSNKFFDIPVENFTINIELFRHFSQVSN